MRGWRARASVPDADPTGPGREGRRPLARSEGEVADEAAAAVRVVPGVVEALALELVAEGVGGQDARPARERLVGDDLVAAEVVAVVERAGHDRCQARGPER